MTVKKPKAEKKTTDGAAAIRLKVLSVCETALPTLDLFSDAEGKPVPVSGRHQSMSAFLAYLIYDSIDAEDSEMDAISAVLAHVEKAQATLEKVHQALIAAETSAKSAKSPKMRKFVFSGGLRYAGKVSVEAISRGNAEALLETGNFEVIERVNGAQFFADFSDKVEVQDLE